MSHQTLPTFPAGFYTCQKNIHTHTVAADLPGELNKSAFHQVRSCSEMGHTSRFQMSYMLNKPWHFVLQQLFFPKIELCICVLLSHRRQKIIKRWFSSCSKISFWITFYLCYSVTFCWQWDGWSFTALKNVFSFWNPDSSLIKAGPHYSFFLSASIQKAMIPHLSLRSIIPWALRTHSCA